MIRALGVGYSPASLVANFVHGALYFLPLYVVTMVVGGAWEVLFAWCAGTRSTRASSSPACSSR